MASHTEGEHKRTLDIVQLKHEQEGQSDQIVATVGKQPKQQHGDKHGRFHKHPPQLVVDCRTPFRIVELAIARIDEIKAHEHHHGYNSHDNQEKMEGLNGHRQ